MLLTSELRYEHDVVLLRQRARQLAALLGFDAQEQTRLATALSEVARNAYQYARGGRAEFFVAPAPAAALLVRVSDRGPGIPHLADVLDGRYSSPTGMGLGLLGARRLTDVFEIDSAPGRGTTVTLGKRLPAGAHPVTPERIGQIAAALTAAAPGDAYAELQQQNQELLRAMETLTERQAEIERLNEELSETNRGVLALYAELDEKALELSRASELKSKFLSNMSHELRTPLNSIINISRLLLARLDGDLSSEQEKQVGLIRSSATHLTEMVNDLLDLARIEAGKTVLRPTDVDVGELLAALRGVFRPLVTTERVTLAFEADEGLPTLHTDEGRVTQILRNLIGNAVKFTEQGEIRVTAEPLPGERVAFRVTDTGIGIAPEDQRRIFEEYEQVEHVLQRRVRGTGLGLPLSRTLARLLGGDLTVESAPGVGSTFTLVLPVRCPMPAEEESHG